MPVGLFAVICATLITAIAFCYSFYAGLAIVGIIAAYDLFLVWLGPGVMLTEEEDDFYH